jgi:hypothetical protein
MVPGKHFWVGNAPRGGASPGRPALSSATSHSQTLVPGPLCSLHEAEGCRGPETLEMCLESTSVSLPTTEIAACVHILQSEQSLLGRKPGNHIMKMVILGSFHSFLGLEWGLKGKVSLAP